MARYVADNGPLDPATATAVLRRCTAALYVAHERGIVHCDIKPANIMLTDHRERAIGDFGIARVSVGRATTTTVGGYSLDHVAPELLDDGSTSVANTYHGWKPTPCSPLIRRVERLELFGPPRRRPNNTLGAWEPIPSRLHP